MYAAARWGHQKPGSADHEPHMWLRLPVHHVHLCHSPLSAHLADLGAQASLVRAPLIAPFIEAHVAD